MMWSVLKSDFHSSWEYCRTQETPPSPPAYGTGLCTIVKSNHPENLRQNQNLSGKHFTFVFPYNKIYSIKNYKSK